MDGGAGDAIALGQLAEALAALPVPQDGGWIELEGRPADVPAFEPGAAHAGAYPLDDQVAFQFRDGSEDDHHRPAQWPSGIDLFAEAAELDVQPVELIEHIEETFHGPGDPVRGPDQLGLGVLIECRDPHVKGGALQDGLRSMPISASHISMAS